MPLRTAHAEQHMPGLQPPLNPLYLLSSIDCELDLGDEHLILRRTGSPVQRFPLRRIARIICNAHTSWRGRALARCLAEGISITWVDAHGHALGYGQPRNPQPCEFGTLIDTYLELPDWSRRFSNWRARRRLEVLSQCAQRALEAGQQIAADEFAELKREYVYNGQLENLFDPTAEAWCLALAVDRLHREGLQACYAGYDGSWLELGAELAALLWAELNLECGTLAASPDNSHLLARLFESWAHRREARLLHHLCDLKRHLAREVQTWH